MSQLDQLGIDILALPCSRNMRDLMFEAKKNELVQVAEAYGMSLEELKNVLDVELAECGAKVGTCNMAINFLIIETFTENKKYESVKAAIKSNILNAAVYYANGIGKSEYV